jgi:hypothetical protein
MGNCATQVLFSKGRETSKKENMVRSGIRVYQNFKKV